MQGFGAQAQVRPGRVSGEEDDVGGVDDTRALAVVAVLVQGRIPVQLVGDPVHRVCLDRRDGTGDRELDSGVAEVPEELPVGATLSVRIRFFSTIRDPDRSKKGSGS